METLTALPVTADEPAPLMRRGDGGDGHPGAV